MKQETARTAAKIMARVVHSGSCWNCSPTPSQTYAIVRHNGYLVRAHRVMLAHDSGIAYEDLPINYVVDHVKARGCMGGHCVNPAHLQLVTDRENIVRGSSMCARNAELTQCPRGHWLAGENLRPSALAIGKRDCLVCNRAHNYVNGFKRRGETPPSLRAAIAFELSRTDKGRDLVARDALGATA